MRRWMPTLVIACVAAALGWLGAQHFGMGDHVSGGSKHDAAAGSCGAGVAPLYWKAPMDPSYVRDAPGKSPMGMDLVPVCPEEMSRGSGEPGIRIDPSMVQSIGVRTSTVARRDLARKIRTVGRVAYDERRVAHVHTKIQGWVEALDVAYEGQLVKRGQSLLEIYSPELLSTQEELLVAQRYRDATGGSDFADVSEGGEALFRATRRRLELWDIPDRDVQRLLSTGEVKKTLRLYAPSAGVVTHMMVREGMEVGPKDNLYTIADLSHVWLYADVYEYELPWIAVGQRGVVELSYLPGTRFEGEVTYVYPSLDPKTRTARVRIELPNPDLILKPEMFANVTIETESRPQVVAVPEEAVIRSGKRSLAVVALGEGRFEPREIQLGVDSGDGWLEVTSGLMGGERIVTSGQFLIDSESKLQEAVQKLLGADTAKPDSVGQEDPERPDAATGHEGHAMPEEEMHHEDHEMPDAPTGHEAHGHHGSQE